MVPMLGSHQAQRKGAVSASRRAFFSGYARVFFHAILLNIIRFIYFNILILNHTDKCNKYILYKILINSLLL
jgi:hypothetical protein